MYPESHKVFSKDLQNIPKQLQNVLISKGPYEMDGYTHSVAYLQNTQRFLMGDMEAVEEGNVCVWWGGYDHI